MQTKVGDPAGVITDFHDRMTPTHVDKPLIHKPEEKLRFAAPTVRVVVGVVLDCHEQFFLLEVGQYPVDDRGINRRSPLQLSKAGQEYAGLV